MSNEYSRDKLDVMKLLLPMAMQFPGEDIIKGVLGLDSDEEYDPIIHWPQYIAVRCGEIAEEVLAVAYTPPC